MANDSSTVNGEKGYRNLLALGIVTFSIVGIASLAIVILIQAAGKPETAQMVWTAVLPLFGSWVGTVLAFYFSKENFEAATRSVTQMAKEITPLEKLKSVPVKDKWIPKDKMFFKRLPADQIKLVETLDELTKAKKGDRIPVLKEKDYPAYIVHRSMIDKYLANKSQSATPPSDPKLLTLTNILDEDAELKKLFETSFATIKEDATLADAKNVMDRTPNCQDMFVTKGGSKDEEILGWITNVIIQENAKV